MNKKLLSGIALSAALTALPALADEAKVEAGARVDADAPLTHETDAGASTTETKIKHKKDKTTIKSTTEHADHKVKNKLDDADAAAVEAEAKAKTSDDDE